MSASLPRPSPHPTLPLSPEAWALNTGTKVSEALQLILTQTLSGYGAFSALNTTQKALSIL